MWFLKREKEKHFVSLFVRKDLWDLDRSPEVESPDIVAVDRPLKPRLVGKKRRGVQGLVPQEVIRAPAVIACATLGNDIYDRSAVVPVLGSIVVAEDFYFGNGVLIRCHTDFVRAAGLDCVQAINRRHRRATSLPRDVRKIGAEAFAHGFNIVVIRRPRYQSQKGGDVTPFG